MTVGGHRDDQNIAFGARGRQVSDMPQMQEVERAVGVHDRLAGLPGLQRDGAELVELLNLLPDLVDHASITDRDT